VVLSALYEKLPASNFSRAVLERARNLAVLPVEGSGWSDWGSPERVFKSLEALGQAESLRARLISDEESAWHGHPAHSQPVGATQSAT
jgi:hypothetical protein